MAFGYSTEMLQLVRNMGGAVQNLPPVTLIGGRKRAFIANLPLAAQVVNTNLVMARVPLFCAITSILVVTDTSLGSATLEIGDQNTPALFAAAATYTAVNTPVIVGLTSALGVPITAGYDGQTGAQVTYAAPGPGGADYEDIVVTVGAADLPGAGNLTMIFEYVID